MCVSYAVVEPVDCKNESLNGENDVKQEETRIIDQFTAVARSDNSQDQLSEINRVVHDGCHAEVNMVDMKLGNSIICYVSCGSSTALRLLYTQIIDGRFADVMQKVFASLNGNVGRLRVVNASGRLSESELQKRITQFNEHLGE